MSENESRRNNYIKDNMVVSFKVCCTLEGLAVVGGKRIKGEVVEDN